MKKAGDEFMQYSSKVNYITIEQNSYEAYRIPIFILYAINRVLWWL